jgi:ribosome-associated translation inhibitor RaiA
MPTYMGVGDKLVCRGCGCEVISRALHDNFHAAMDERLAELERQLNVLKRDMMNRSAAERLGILAVV